MGSACGFSRKADKEVQGLAFGETKKERLFGYLRFLNILFVPYSVMYSKPDSISCMASFSLCATVAVNLSFWFVNRACSRLM